MAWKTVKYRWKWKLNSSPSEVWAQLNDTQTINTIASLPTTEAGATPSDFAQKFLFSADDTTENADSCHWIRQARISSTHQRPHAAIGSVASELLLEKSGDGTLVKMALAVTPSTLVGMLATPLLIGRRSKKTLQTFFQSLNDESDGTSERAKKSLLTAKQTANLATGRETLLEEGFKEEWVDAFCDMLTYDPASALVYLRPYAFAEANLFPRKKILALFVAANEAGILTSDWLVTCTECGQWKARHKRLRDIDTKITCPSCKNKFDIHLDENVELIFSSHPTIRRTPKGGVDPYNPKANPNVLIRQTLAPSAVMTLKIRLAPGRYSVHSTNAHAEEWAHFTVDTSGPGEVTCEAVKDGMDVTRTPNQSESRIILANRTPESQLFVLQEDSWTQQRCTALEANCCQRYRQCFASDAPDPLAPVPVKSVYILVSDVVASTAMCASLGDVEGFSVIRDIYDFQEKIIDRLGGAIIKTYGDALFAAFTSGQEAMAAALSIQSDFDSYNATQHMKEQTSLKLSLHSGRCIAVNLADQLDLFGSTISMAAHLLHLCNKGNIVASEQAMKASGVKGLLDSDRTQSEPFETQIEGFDTATKLTRIALTSALAAERAGSEGNTETGAPAEYAADLLASENSGSATDDNPFAELRFDDETEDGDSTDAGNIYV